MVIYRFFLLAHSHKPICHKIYGFSIVYSQISPYMAAKSYAATASFGLNL